jgi:predicted DNA binding CopG/RHH family protein
MATSKQMMESKDYTINVRAWEWLVAAIERKAKQEGMKVPDWTREALIRAVESDK